ncbi:MAG: Wadjet anti-phage system protein JetA family protein [Clostridium fessum]
MRSSAWRPLSKKSSSGWCARKACESLTENVLEYCEGDFIREYARLTKQQNIHMYRSFIRSKLEAMQNRQELFEGLVAGCAKEEELKHIEAENKVLDMIQTILQFFSVDYDQIMRDIKHKINIYLQIAIDARDFFKPDSDVRGHVEQTIRVIAAEMNTLGWKEELPESMNGLFLLENNEFIDTDSIRYPRREQMIREATYAELEEMTQEDIDRAREAQEREAENPYSGLIKMKNYLEALLGDRTEISSEEVPMKSKRDLLSALSAVAYGSENGYEIQAE